MTPDDDVTLAGGSLDAANDQVEKVKWTCTYCNEENETPNTAEDGVGITDCSRCGTRRSR